MARRRWDFNGPTKVYRLYDEHDTLLYIGVTVGTYLRFRQHAVWTWWRDVDDWTVTPYPTRAAALVAEREAIETELPLYNVQWNQDNPHRVQPTMRPRSKPLGTCPACHRIYCYNESTTYGTKTYPPGMVFHIGSSTRCAGVSKPPLEWVEVAA